MSLLAVASGMWLVGVASSLHCIGMCGPLVLSFARAGGRALPGAAPLGAEFLPYHLGRIWTYGLLGLLAGALGGRLAEAGGLLGFERPFAIAAGLLVMTSGVALLAGGRIGLGTEGVCGRGLVRASALVQAVAGGRGFAARALLGTLMGFLPCGLVYAMLGVAVSLGSPVRGAVGMAAFGAGTVPALVAVLGLARLLPPGLRAQGGRIAAIALVLAGLWMIVRATALSPSGGSSSHCAEASAAPRPTP